VWARWPTSLSAGRAGTPRWNVVAADATILRPPTATIPPAHASRPRGLILERVDGGAADARALALAEYLRERAAALSLSADVNEAHQIAQAGMALLDAAATAETLPAEDPTLIALSEAGRFETMPGNKARFVETPRLRAAVQRPISGAPMAGQQILALLVDSAAHG
jgi:hypothetical protein